MAAPQIGDTKPVHLAEVKKILVDVEKRDKELNYRSNKAKEYLDNFVLLSTKQAEEVRKKLEGLNLTRLKEEHISKITDFLPKTVDDLKVVLQAYPLSLPKKDQEAIIGVTKDLAP
jgi:DNA-directed RNA polymerase subunit F